jgi:transposase-like protein
MGSIARERRGVNAQALFASELANAQAAVVKQLAAAVEQGLERQIDQVLGRGAYQRREQVAPWIEVRGICQRCKSRQSRRFSRNGRRARCVLTQWGEVTIALQRVVCECGGSVRLEMEGWLRPYQRIGEDVESQVQRWGALRLSLREMQREMAQLHITPLALRTLNQRLQQVAPAPTSQEALSVPPVLQIDALWVTQRVPTGAYHRDAKARLRPNKKRIKRPVLIALGVWPETGRAEVLAWRLAAKEDEGEWLAFLSQLEAMGIRGENGLELIIHDGGSGLCAALQTIYFGASEQRCLFHKLRNLYHAIRLPDPSLTRQQQRQQRKAIFRDFHQIWQTKRLATVLHRYRHVVRRYRKSQPEAVACLRSDFRATIAYFAVHARHPDWQDKHLRTTSRLERFNRRLRRRVRAASAYHSDAGLCAMPAQEVQAFNTGTSRP